eukprot:gene22371-biopygen4226
MNVSHGFYRRMDSPPLGQAVVAGTQGCPQKNVYPVLSGAAVRPSGRLKLRFSARSATEWPQGYTPLSLTVGI